MNLRSKRLFLKEADWEDVEDFHLYFSNTKIHEFNTIILPETIDHTKGILAPFISDKMNNTRKLYTWAVKLPDNMQFIGEVGMTRSLNRFNLAEIYYGLLPNYWHQGYATEMVQRVVRFGFNYLKLHRIEAGVAKENLASIQVLEKSGFQREGLRRKLLPVRGEWMDSYLYAILEED